MNLTTFLIAICLLIMSIALIVRPRSTDITAELTQPSISIPNPPTPSSGIAITRGESNVFIGRSSGPKWSKEESDAFIRSHPPTIDRDHNETCIGQNACSRTDPPREEK